MQRWRLIFDPIFKIIALVCLCLPAIYPFLQGEMLRTDDGYLHLYRVVALDHALQADGTFYPRYASGIVYGYGASLFNYFPPTSYYPAVFLHGLGFTYIQGWLVSIALYMVLAAGGAYLLGRTWSGEIAGWLTATAYVYSPYLTFDALTRGTSSELAGLAVLPWALWGFTRLAHMGDKRAFLSAVLTFALFIPMHNIVTLHGTLLLVSYATFLWLSNPDKKRTFIKLFSAGCVALLMTSFFWLPALGETGDTRITATTETLASIDVTRSLRSVAEIFTLPHTADISQLQAIKPIVLGWGQAILALIGLWLGRHQPKLRTLIFVLLIMTFVAVILQTPIATPIWTSVKLLSYSQFAWRIMGLPSLTLALMAGIGGALLCNRIRVVWGKNAILSVIVSILVCYSMPWLYAPQIPLAVTSIVDAQDYERRTGQLTLSSYSEYLPIWHTEALDSMRLVERFASGDAIIARLIAPEPVTIESAIWRGTAGDITLTSETETLLTFDWLYVQGWQASLNGDAIPVVPSQGQGLVSVTIPAGSHQLQIYLSNTPLQNISWGLSISGVILLILGTTVIRTQPTEYNRPEWRWTGLVALIGISLLLVKIGVIDRINSPIHTKHLVDGAWQGTEGQINANFGGDLRLLAYSHPNSLKSGENAQITLFWTLQGDTIDTDYSSNLHLRDSAGNLVVEIGSFQIGGLATSHWLEGFYLQESLTLAIPATIPPATYHLDIGVYDPVDLRQLNILHSEGNPIGVRAPLGTITITRPDVSTQAEGALASHNGLGLLSITGVPERAMVGDPITLTMLWQAEPALQDQQIRLRWTDENGTHHDSLAFAPVAEYPINQWQVGDVWQGIQQIYVNGNLSAGDYGVSLMLNNFAVPLGTMVISEPERDYELPNPTHQHDIVWQNGLRLMGSDTVTMVTLYWQTDTLINQNLRLFVQILDAQDRILALTDGVPVDWTRPTTGWSLDEYITTNHPFSNLPEGNYRIRVGWVDSTTQARILLIDGTDSVILENVLIVE